VDHVRKRAGKAGDFLPLAQIYRAIDPVNLMIARRNGE
jgi:hypothetical protein